MLNGKPVLGKTVGLGVKVGKQWYDASPTDGDIIASGPPGYEVEFPKEGPWAPPNTYQIGINAPYTGVGTVCTVSGFHQVSATYLQSDPFTVKPGEDVHKDIIIACHSKK